MGSTQFGNFGDFCRDSTLPVCNLFVPSNLTANSTDSFYGGCELLGIGLSGGRHLANLGSILFAFISILVSLFLIWRSDRKQAAVGRREMQLFLLGFVIIEICEIFSVGGIPLRDDVRKGFSAVHIAAITATCWILFLNALVGFQFLDDGTPASIVLFAVSGGIIFVGTGYIALDTAFDWSHEFTTNGEDGFRNIALYVLYQLFPLVCLVVFFLLEMFLVVRILGEFRPMLYLASSAVLFAIGQIFNYVISTHICTSTDGKINGALFETFFTLISVVMLWIFWSSITEDDWPMPISQPMPGYN